MTINGEPNAAPTVPLAKCYPSGTNQAFSELPNSTRVCMDLANYPSWTDLKLVARTVSTNPQDANNNSRSEPIVIRLSDAVMPH